MDISIGPIQAAKMAIGPTEILKVSVGDNLVWPSTQPTTSFSWSTSVTFTTPSFTVPGTWAVGDLAVLFDRGSNTSGGAPALGAMSGWTIVDSAIIDSANSAVYYKILESADLGRVFYGIDGGQSDSKLLFRFRARTATGTVVPVLTVTKSSYLEAATNANPLGQNHIVTGYANGMSQLFGFYGSSNSPMGQIMTQDGVDCEDYSDASSRIYVLNKQLFGGNQITVDMGDPGSENCMISFILTIT